MAIWIQRAYWRHNDSTQKGGSTCTTWFSGAQSTYSSRPSDTRTPPAASPSRSPSLPRRQQTTQPPWRGGWTGVLAGWRVEAPLLGVVVETIFFLLSLTSCRGCITRKQQPCCLSPHRPPERPAKMPFDRNKVRPSRVCARECGSFSCSHHQRALVKCLAQRGANASIHTHRTTTSPTPTDPPTQHYHHHTRPSHRA